MGGHRSGMHYRAKNSGGDRTSRSVHSYRDAAYRSALGVEGAGPLPREIGSVQHNRPEERAGYLD